MGELSNRMMVSGGNISGIAGQLVKEGLITRQALPENRRTFIVKLSPKGRRFFQEMAVRHEQWIVALLGELNMKDVNQAMGLLGKVKATLEQN